MESRRIKLLLVSSVFVDRGVERILLFLYTRLPRERYDITIVCLRNLSPFADYLNKNTNITIDVIGMKNNVDILSLYRFYKYIKRVKPDIINFHSFRAALWGRPIARIAKVPTILYSVHNKWGGAVHRLLGKMMSGFSDAIIPFSLAVKNYLSNNEKIHKRYIEDPIYIGIDIDKFSYVKEDEIASLKKELELNEGQIIIGFVGNLSKQKGLTYLIESIKSLKSNYPDLCCLIIGDGPEEDALKTKIAEYKLNNNFKFLGQRYDTPNLLHIMKIFVLPSLWEGLPQVVIEAMAASCPVIATDVDGTPEIITHKHDGWLVSPANIAELTNAIETLVTNEAVRKELAHNGYMTVKDKFNVKTMVANYDRLYQSYFDRKS